MAEVDHKISKGRTYNPLTISSSTISGDFSRFLFTVGARIPAQFVDLADKKVRNVPSALTGIGLSSLRRIPSSDVMESNFSNYAKSWVSSSATWKASRRSNEGLGGEIIDRHCGTLICTVSLLFRSSSNGGSRSVYRSKVNVEELWRSATSGDWRPIFSSPF